MRRGRPCFACRGKMRVDGARFRDMSSMHTSAPPPPRPLPGQLTHSAEARNFGIRVENG
jgi:hypothetical protein